MTEDQLEQDATEHRKWTNIRVVLAELKHWLWDHERRIKKLEHDDGKIQDSE